MATDSETILFQEFIGLIAMITNSSDKSLEGIQGRILDETKNTFRILSSPPHRSVIVPKSVATFRFSAQPSQLIDGRNLVGDSASRITRMK